MVLRSLRDTGNNPVRTCELGTAFTAWVEEFGCWKLCWCSREEELDKLNPFQQDGLWNVKVVTFPTSWFLSTCSVVLDIQWASVDATGQE